MNRLHAWYCRTAHWHRTVERNRLDWTIGGVCFGDDLLELGTGNGTATMYLRRMTVRLTAVDIDRGFLGRLRRRIQSDESGMLNVEPNDARVRPVQADAARLPFCENAFSSVAAFTMMHHVAGAEGQRLLLSEVRRVLRPNGLFVGCDVVWTLGLRVFHLCDTFAPADPDRWPAELVAAGFDDVHVAKGGRYFRWSARCAERLPAPLNRTTEALCRA